MSDEQDVTDLDEHGRQLFEALPRESAPRPHELDHLVSALRAEGFFRARAPRLSWAMQLAAAIVLVVVGGMVGAKIATRNSLEAQLERTDLSVSDRILLMQRAGSAYVRASNAYAGSVARADSTAVEVASRVLMGAAQAVARSDLDGGVSSRLTAALRARDDVTAPPPTPQRVIWF
jgi:hypothetical protein